MLWAWLGRIRRGTKALGVLRSSWMREESKIWILTKALGRNRGRQADGLGMERQALNNELAARRIGRSLFLTSLEHGRHSLLILDCGA